MAGTGESKLNRARVTGRAAAVPTFVVRERPRSQPAPIVLGSEAQLDRDADERAVAAVLDALKQLDEWSSEHEIKRRLPPELGWQVPEILARLEAAGKASSARPRWRGTPGPLWRAR